MRIRLLASAFAACWIGFASVADAAEQCPEKVVTSASASASLAAHPTMDAARDAAVRRAVVNAVAKVGGIEVGRHFASVEHSTLTEINHETLQKLRMRSSARVISWEITGEETRNDETGKPALSVTITADICPNASGDIPLVVAFDFKPDAQISTQGYRERLSSLFPPIQGYEMTLGQPATTYYDLLISGEVVRAEAVERDRTQAVQVLQNYLGKTQTAHLPLKKQRVSVSVLVKAVTFLGDSETVVYRTNIRDIALESDPGEPMASLAQTAMDEAAQELFTKIFNRKREAQ